jgi:hypothetical protein
VTGLATRALFTGITAAPPEPVVETWTSPPQGGWSTPTYPKAVYAAGHTFVGYINGLGNISVLRYDHATHGVTTITLDTPSPIDDHNNPAIMVRPDGHLLALFSEHDGSAIYRMISTNPGDISSWGAAQNTGQSSPDGMTYPAVARLSGVAGTPCVMLYRDKLAVTTGRLSMAKSGDDGTWWTAKTIVMAPGGGFRPYWGLAHDATKVHVMTTDRDAYGAEGVPMLGHMYYDGTTDTWHKSDGTQITATKPFAHTELTQVHTGNCFVMDGLVVGGKPRFTVLEDNGDDTVTGKLYRWTGSAWVTSTIYTAPYHPFDRYYGSLVINRARTSEVFAALAGGSQPEVYRFLSPDGGATWGDPIAVTSGSAAANATPIAVHDGIAALPVVWLRGDYTSQHIFNLGMMALRR